MEWLKDFLGEHGERLVFMGIVTMFGVAFRLWVPDMEGEANTLLLAVPVICLNKARSKKKD